MGSYPPQYAYPSAPPLYRAMPKPPRLHWGWLLALGIITRGLFNIVWLVVQANWVRKVNGKSKAFVWSIIYLCFIPALFIAGVCVGILAVAIHQQADTLLGVLTIMAVFGALALHLGTVFTLRSELEASPIGIPLSGGMTFFFGPIYFQYHLRDYGSTEPFTTGSLGLSAQAPTAAFTGIPVEGQYLPDGSAQGMSPHPNDGMTR